MFTFTFTRSISSETSASAWSMIFWSVVLMSVTPLRSIAMVKASRSSSSTDTWPLKSVAFQMVSHPCASTRAGSMRSVRYPMPVPKKV